MDPNKFLSSSDKTFRLPMLDGIIAELPWPVRVAVFEGYKGCFDKSGLYDYQEDKIMDMQYTFYPDVSEDFLIRWFDGEEVVSESESGIKMPWVVFAPEIRKSRSSICNNPCRYLFVNIGSGYVMLRIEMSLRGRGKSNKGDSEDLLVGILGESGKDVSE